MKPITIEIHETTQTNGVDENGDFSFYLYASNACDQEFEKAIDTLKLVWDAPMEVSLSINLSLKGVYRDVFEKYRKGTPNVVDAESVPVFAAIRKDCQWIIDQIDGLETPK